jgi:hypothetical protein
VNSILAELMSSILCINVNVSFMYEPKCTFTHTRPLLLTPTCFDHFCDHLQGVQYKYQEYNGRV